MKLPLVLCLLGLSTIPLAHAAWQPEATERERYAAVLRSMEQGEGYTGFTAAEKKLIAKPDDAYFAERWNFLRKVHGAPVATPGKEVAEFVDACLKDGWLAAKDRDAFQTAVVCLGKELIVDKSPFEVPLGGTEVTRDVPYADYAGYRTKLDVFRPAAAVASKPLPCIVFIHCGGWEVHKRAWFECHARVAAREGFVAANIDYRLLPGVSPVECVHDAKAAIRHVRANADRYGIDPDKIFAFGASAGAHLVATLATTADQTELEGHGGNAGVSSRIRAGACFATPALSGRQTWPVKGQHPLPPWFRKISPYEHAGSGDSPLLFIHGANDTLVSPDEPKDLKAKLDAAGVPCVLEIVPQAGHVCYMSEAMSMKAIAYFRSF